jgi:phosphohistidine phosphatase
MTAQIVAEVTEFPQASIVETPTLTPSALPDTALAFVANFQHMEDVLVAGHIPSLTRMAAVLLAGNAFATITLETTGICCIACETLPTHSGVMQWLLTPEQLRLIAGNHGA